MTMASDKVKVAVRVRPFNRREIELGTKVIVDMENNQTFLKPVNDRLDGRKQGKVFAFDHCFWSMEESDPKFAGQEEVFECVGSDILERAFEGYNGCIFAYGQTGSGKSYTMMGSGNQKGLIPRLCDRLFERIADKVRDDLSCKVEVSYMEIYNERVHDLLDPKRCQQHLKVREHNILGPYVDGLSLLAVKSFEDIDNLMNEGNKSRTVAATNMNNESSRSHAVFNIVLTQTLVDTDTATSGEKASKLSLVDLAGSERAQKTGAIGERLKEGSNINKSLTTLGLVISALADQSAGGGKKGAKFVPYRDSVLTWLLKDNLGGNSKTVMVATVSPAADNYEETLSTLRYADRAKRIVNHAVINEDPNARIIRELREEVETLRQQLSAAKSLKAPELQDRLLESEKLMKDMTKTWEEKLAETEKVHMERHKALEEMGVSVQTSGIRVDNPCPYLVNLNADPSLNELLVYYLKEHTLVGRPDAVQQQDIQLSGLGIMPQHAVVDVANNEVFITPLQTARTCVNGSIIKERQRVKHGDRIVWGNNHFFRLNCPKPANCPQSPEGEDQQTLDYDFAQQELMEKELGNDPVQEAIGAIEKQHEEDKQEALERQRQMYERQMQMLRNQLMSPGTPSFPVQLFDASRFIVTTPTTPNGSTTPTSTINSIQRKYQQWAQDREKKFKQSLAKLREEVVKANALVREANFLSQEMRKQTHFHVTLQIPAANLSPNRRRGAFVSEPAISVTRKRRSGLIWTLEKLENKIIDMREMYEERKAQGLPMMDELPPQPGDPFYDSQENHSLIGVANIFLECLFHDVKLAYHVPIISQQGEVAGKLHIEISKLGGAVLDRYVDLAAEGNAEETSVPMGAPLLIRVCIREARGLPPALAHFVFCQYSFWGQAEAVVVPPEINPDHPGTRGKDTASFTFNHEKEFRIPITEEFIEFCSDGALSIEVWGHRSHGLGKMLSVADAAQAKTRSLADRWSEVMRKVEMWVEFHELNDQGEYSPVQVLPKPDVPCGGVFQLRQGHSRRVLVRIKPASNSGTLPLICESVASVHIGCLAVRSKLQRGLDSYQEEDLTILRERWSSALARRKQYLDEQIQKLIHKADKTEADSERERALIEQWVCLTEERNAVLVPSPGSSIPGAPADWKPPPNVEEHSPVLFLDLNADDMSFNKAKEGLQAVGLNSIVPKEHSGQFVPLPVIKYFTEADNVCALGSWDSSLHDSSSLNRLTTVNERLYMVVKAVVRLSHPASMELVLRKRVAINIYKKQGLTSLTHMLKNRLYGADYLTDSGILYEVVSNLPKSSEELEDLETLAQMAASHNDSSAVDGESYIEKYVKGISAVESILTLDRLRQEVAVKELKTVPGQPKSLRKTTSVPNINQFLTGGVVTPEAEAESAQESSLVDQLSTKSRNFPGELFRLRSLSEVTETMANLAKATCQRKRHSLATPKLSSGTLTVSMGKAVKPMKTVVEEQHCREVRPLLYHDTEEEEEEDTSCLPPHPQKPRHLMRAVPDLPSAESDDYQEFESFQSQQQREREEQAHPHHNHNNHDTTTAAAATVSSSVAGPTAQSCAAQSPESITDSVVAESIQAKAGYAPSITSSGYGSQAVSTLTLSSDDSLSIKSMDDPESVVAKVGATLKRSGFGASLESDSEDGNLVGNEKVEKLIEEEEEDEDEEDLEESETERALEMTSSVEDVQVETFLHKEDASFSSSSSSAKLQQREEGEGGEPTSPLQFIDDGVPTPPPPSSHGENTRFPFREPSPPLPASENMVKSSPEMGDDRMTTTMMMMTVSADGLDSRGPLSNRHARSVSLQDANCLTSSAPDFPLTSPGPGQNLMFTSSESTSASSSENLARVDSKTKTGGEEKEKKKKAFSSKSSSKKIASKNAKNKDLDKNAGSNPALKSPTTTTTTTSSKSAPKASKSKKSPKSESSTPIEGSGSEKKGGGSSKGKRWGSGMRSRPKSMLVSPKVETATRAWQEEVCVRSGIIHSSEDSLPATTSEDNVSDCSFGSRADLDRLLEGPVPAWVKEGEGVVVASTSGTVVRTGLVRFVGPVVFAPGNWVGVELDLAEGKNDGSVKGVRYFQCRSRHGVFVRPDKLTPDKKRKGSKKGIHPGHRRSASSASDSLLESSTTPSSSLFKPSPSTQLFAKPFSAGFAKKQ